MAHPFDPQQIGTQIVSKLNALANADLAQLSAFADRQATLLAKQAAWIAEATILHELTDDDREWFVNNLKDLTENFARVVVGLTLLTIEKAWNAIVDVLWGAINGAIKAAGIPIVLPIPGAPPA